MLPYPAIDPIAFRIFGWPVHWYGLTYLIGILLGWMLLMQRIKDPRRGFSQDNLSDIVFFAALGVILGGRIGYMLFYDWHVFFTQPLMLLQVWRGGMSFHGGLIGVLLAMWYCAHKFHKPFLEITDLIAPVVPLGLGAGRIGNFINGELWGRVTDMPWGMIFPDAGPFPRHPSQLYEFALEGIVLFLILWCYSSKPRPLGAISGLFALFYGVFRCIVEFYREPDPQLGYLAFDWLTMGQLLSLPLMLVGILLIFFAYKRYGKTQ